MLVVGDRRVGRFGGVAIEFGVEDVSAGAGDAAPCDLGGLEHTLEARAEDLFVGRHRCLRCSVAVVRVVVRVEGEGVGNAGAGDASGDVR